MGRLVNSARLATSGPPPSGSVLDDELFHYYTLEESSGVRADSAGTTFAPTRDLTEYNGVIDVAGKIGRGDDFDTNANGPHLRNEESWSHWTNLTTGFAYGMWMNVQPTTPSHNYPLYMVRGSGIEAFSRFEMRSDKELRCSLSLSTGSNGAQTSEDPLISSVWSSYMWGYDPNAVGAEWWLYVNGAPAVTNPTDSPASVNWGADVALLLGASAVGGNERAYTWQDELGLWGRHMPEADRVLWHNETNAGRGFGSWN